MNLSLSARALVAAAVCFTAPLEAHQVQPPQDSPPTVHSSGQSGGVTAWHVGTVVFEAPPADDRTRQLVSALNLFRTQFMGQLRQTLSTSAYIYLVDLPRHEGQPRNTHVMYWIFVDDGHDSIYRPVCQVTSEVQLGGIAAYMPLDQQVTSIPMRMLGARDRPLLQRLCDGLRQPLSTLRRERRSGSQRDESTVYDYLVRSAPVLMFMLMPARMQEQSSSAGAARHFWASALVGRYNRLPASDEIMSDPDAFAQMSSFEEGELVNIPMPIVQRFGISADGYPREARREFGDRIQTLDADWVRYLSGAAVTIRGRQIPLMDNGRPVEVLPSFSASEIGTPAFWLAASDWARTYEMVSCIAGRFLSDRYHMEASEADMGRCAISETSLSP